MEYKDATDIIAGLHNGLDWIDRKIRGTWVQRAFWHGIRVRWYTPPVLVSKTYEVEEPFRRSRAIVLRFWWNRSVVLGFWGKTGYDEDANLLEATIWGRPRTDGERKHWSDSPVSVPEGLSSEILGGRPGLRDGATRNARADVSVM